jgi:hypothetical protein
MDRRLNLINKLLRLEDIEGLLSIGAPDDEYESEAKLIADRVAEHQASGREVAKEEVASIIAEVWKEMFELSDDELLLRREAFQSVAARLISQ